MKVAVVQFAPVVGAKEENLRRLALLVKEAAGKGAQLIVMPELAATGYGYMNREEARRDAEKVGPDGLTFRVMRKLAEKFGVHLVWGMVEEASGTKLLYNSQVLLSPDGFYTSYAKINRWGNDFLWAAPGASNPPIARLSAGGSSLRVGLLICRDIRDKKNDKWSDFYERGDADLVCLSANWGDGGFPAVSWMDFVEDNGAALAVSNRYGQEGPNNFGEGGVCVIQRDGTVHCDGLVWSQDCVVLADVGSR